MWRSRLLSCLGKTAKITSFMEERCITNASRNITLACICRYSVQDWRHAFLETLRLQEVDLVERNSMQQDIDSGQLSSYDSTRLKRLLAKVQFVSARGC